MEISALFVNKVYAAKFGNSILNKSDKNHTIQL